MISKLIYNRLMTTLCQQATPAELEELGLPFCPSLDAEAGPCITSETEWTNTIHLLINAVEVEDNRVIDTLITPLLNINFKYIIERESVNHETYQTWQYQETHSGP